MLTVDAKLVISPSPELEALACKFTASMAAFSTAVEHFSKSPAMQLLIERLAEALRAPPAERNPDPSLLPATSLTYLSDADSTATEAAPALDAERPCHELAGADVIEPGSHCFHQWSDERLAAFDRWYISGVPMDEIVTRLNAMPGSALTKKIVSNRATLRKLKRPARVKISTAPIFKLSDPDHSDLRSERPALKPVPFSETSEQMLATQQSELNVARVPWGVALTWAKNNKVALPATAKNISKLRRINVVRDQHGLPPFLIDQTIKFNEMLPPPHLGGEDDKKNGYKKPGVSV